MYADVVKQAQIITMEYPTIMRKQEPYSSGLTAILCMIGGALFWNILEVFVSSRCIKRQAAICEGFTNLTVALLQAVDIPLKGYRYW